MTIDPNKIRLTPQDSEHIKGMIERTAAEVARRRKDTFLNIRINSIDLASIKRKAKKLGVPYQSLVSELLHQYAR